MDSEQILVKYPKISVLGSMETEGILNEVVVCQSKIDGANFRCRYIPEQDKLVFGSRSQILINPNIIQWKACVSFIKAFEEHKEHLISDVIYFAESTQKHTISYDNIPDAVGYDIYDISRGEFYHWKAAKIAFEKIGIPFINVHFEKHGSKVTTDELYELIKTSPYRAKGDEGIVLKCYSKKSRSGRPLFAKVVDELFKEENKKTFRTKVPAITWAEQEIVNRYLTPARFDKAIFHLKEQGHEIDMSSIPELYKYLVSDVLSENIIDISKEWKSMNFKIFNKIVVRTCASMLKKQLIKTVPQEIEEYNGH